MKIERKTCRASDGVTITYSCCGAGDPALLFIHGGLAERSFWDGQLQAFGGRHRVVAPDLPGHGESGSDRTRWGIPEFGADVKAVADAENLRNMILFGNSLGGPAGVEAALLMPGRVLAVVGIDTFHRIDYRMSVDQARERAEAFRTDYAGSVRAMVKMLLHSDAPSELLAEAERRMQTTPPDAAYKLFISLGDYDPVTPIRRLTVPLRAINGDLFPTDLASVRESRPEFDAIVMQHTGHYPMLERPDEFNTRVGEMVASLTIGTANPVEAESKKQ